MRRYVRFVMKVERVDDASPKQHEPQPVDRVAGELSVFGMSQLASDQADRAELRSRWRGLRILRRLDSSRNLKRLSERDARPRFLFRRVEDGNELQRSRHRFFTDRRKLHVAPHERVLVDGEQPLKIDLFVIRNEKMIVTLGTLQIKAEEDSADVARQARKVRRILPVTFQPLCHEERRCPGGFVFGVRVEQLVDELVPRFVFGERSHEPGTPIRIIPAPLHQHHVESTSHLLGVAR